MGVGVSSQTLGPGGTYRPALRVPFSAQRLPGGAPSWILHLEARENGYFGAGDCPCQKCSQAQLGVGRLPSQELGGSQDACRVLDKDSFPPSDNEGQWEGNLVRS